MADLRDRTPPVLELRRTPWPAAPLNLFFTSTYQEGVIDLWWDDPATLALNSEFQILGVNVYRSFDSEFGPFERVTELPVGASYWRDQTDNELIVEEDVTDRFVLFGYENKGEAQAPQYVFRTLHSPIVKEGSQKVPAGSPWDVRVFVDGVEARVLRVLGAYGQVEIDAQTRADAGTQKAIPPVIPGSGSRVTCTYRRSRSFLKTDLFQRIFYRVTTVGLPAGMSPSSATPADLLETPLEHAVSTSTVEIEKLDYIWREAVRRNKWILEQGGERVKVFVQKNVGAPCLCWSQHHKQAVRDCETCYGTGIVGGYEGPYDILIAPDDAERRIAQTDIGRRKEHSYEVWTGPSPLLSMRDFLVKLNNDRYSIGGVRMPSNRGMVLQQHFTMNVIDSKDIRGKVPVSNPIRYAASQFTPSGPEYEASAEITDNPAVEEGRQLRGRSLPWQNGNY
jgi:hypothetical protein